MIRKFKYMYRHAACHQPNPDTRHQDNQTQTRRRSISQLAETSTTKAFQPPSAEGIKRNRKRRKEEGKRDTTRSYPVIYTITQTHSGNTGPGRQAPCLCSRIYLHTHTSYVSIAYRYFRQVIRRCKCICILMCLYMCVRSTFDLLLRLYTCHYIHT
ncbi:hypothetical protein F4810DRAFT_248415 [Camillea tinctor]|nr:hypothetical protein F4810DRAFT_248415 [Camillea tinctor]